MKRILFFVVAVMLAGRFAAAIGGPYSSLSGEVVRIDPSYQTTIPVGNDNQNVEAIEFSEDGFIYGVNPVWDTLIRIDPSTGVAETVGPLGVDLGWNTDLDEDDQGQLRMLVGETGKLFAIDRASGAASLQCQANNTLLGGLVTLDGFLYTSSYYPDPPDPGCGLEYISGYAPYLERGPDGWIHGLNYWYLPQFVYCDFFRIDPTSGNREELGTFAYFWDRLDGLTFNPAEQALPSPIPTIGWQGHADAHPAARHRRGCDPCALLNQSVLTSKSEFETQRSHRRFTAKAQRRQRSSHFIGHLTIARVTAGASDFSKARSTDTTLKGMLEARPYTGRCDGCGGSHPGCPSVTYRWVSRVQRVERRRVEVPNPPPPKWPPLSNAMVRWP